MANARHTIFQDLLPGLSGNNHQKARKSVRYTQTARVSFSATGKVTIAAFAGRVRLDRVTLVSDAALAADGANYYDLKIINQGTDGSGSTQIGSTVSTSTKALTAFDQLDLAAPASTIAADGVLALSLTKTGTPAALNGLVVVEYSPILD